MIALASLDFYNINNTNHKSINFKNQTISANPLNVSKPIQVSTSNFSTKPDLAKMQNFDIKDKTSNLKAKNTVIKIEIPETNMDENLIKSNEDKTNSIVSTTSPINSTSLKLNLTKDNFLLRENQDLLNPFSYELYASPSLTFNTNSNDYNQLKDNSNNKKYQSYWI